VKDQGNSSGDQLCSTSRDQNGQNTRRSEVSNEGNKSEVEEDQIDQVDDQNSPAAEARNPAGENANGQRGGDESGTAIAIPEAQSKL
jgi:hypothetical protein